MTRPTLTVYFQSVKTWQPMAIGSCYSLIRQQQMYLFALISVSALNATKSAIIINNNQNKQLFYQVVCSVVHSLMICFLQFYSGIFNSSNNTFVFNDILVFFFNCIVCVIYIYIYNFLHSLCTDFEKQTNNCIVLGTVTRELHPFFFKVICRLCGPAYMSLFCSDSYL